MFRFLNKYFSTDGVGAAFRRGMIDAMERRGDHRAEYSRCTPTRQGYAQGFAVGLKKPPIVIESK